MARSKSFEKNLRLLVKCITDFEEDEENFTICLDYASSGLKYHRYLEPNSHQIHRSIEGLIEKFQIHSQNEKAEALKLLVTKYLEIPAFEDREHGKTMTHYAILSLLLCLSYSPLLVPYTKPITEVLAEKEEKFDWTSYLLEGIDIHREHYLDLSDSSDDYDDEEATDDTAKDARSRLTFAEDVSCVKLPAADPDHPQQDHEFCMEEYDWLKRNVVVQYWLGHVSNRLEAKSKCNLLHDWEHYQSRINPVFGSGNKLQVTEHHIIRETIWLLLGVPSSVVYIWNGSEYSPNDDLCVTHLTQRSLSSILTLFSHYGTTVRCLDEFVNDVTTSSSVCQTYQAFASVLSAYIQEMQKELVSVEKDVLLQEESHTLMKLLEDLRPRLAELETLETVYAKGIAAFSRVTSASQKASGLLSVLFEMITESDIMGEYDTDKVSLLLSLWIQSSKPYLDIIDQWTSEGQLIDPKEEFILQRNIDIRSFDENFWDTAFILHCTDRSQAESSRTGPPTGQVMPSFLLPVLNQIILAGKSMELIQHLGYLSQVHQARKKRSLFEQFIKSLEAMFGKKTALAEGESEKEPNNLTKDNGSAAFRENASKQMQQVGTFDPLLRLNFINMLVADVTSNESTTGHITDRKLEVAFNGTTPVKVLLEKCLYPHITNRSAELLHILKQHYNLNEYFAAMKRIYLLEAGNMMFDFYRHIFDKLRFREQWQDSMFLNYTLQEALMSHHPNDAKNVYVSLEPKTDTKSQKGSHLLALESLTIHYKVPWPVNIILNSKCLQTYNEVFSFLLQIKRVKYSLDELSFKDLEREDRHKSHDPEIIILGKVEEASVQRRQRVHRVHITRMKLMHFVNNLHNYIMTRILHSTGLEFEEMLTSASDLDAVIKGHNNYLATVHQRCLLHKKVTFIKDIITKILELALALAYKWEEGIDNFSEQQLVEIESEFSYCIQFLSSVISNFIKRGSFPHLESLAFALVTSNEAMRR